MRETRDGGGCVAAREIGYLEHFDNRAVEIVERLKSANERMERLADRLVGCSPENEAVPDRDKEPQPPGVVPTLACRLTDIERLVNGLYVELERLERL